MQTCPKCRALLPPGTKTCPYCETDQGAVRAATPEADARATTRVGTWLLVANVALFFLSVQLDPMRGDQEGAFRPSSVSLVGFGANHPTQIDECGQYWRLLAANFLHADLLHIAFNSVALFVLMPLAAVTLGLHRMLCIYFAAGVFGFFVSHSAGMYSVGASAAVSGMIGALAVFGKRRGALHLTRQMVMWGGLILLIGFVSSASSAIAIDNWGHIGGMVGGAALGWPAARVRARGSREDRLWRIGAYGWVAACVLVAVVWQIPSVIRTMDRRDVIVYAADAEGTLDRIRQVAVGRAAPDKLPESFEEGPAHSSLLAERIRQALAAVRRDPRGATEPLRQAAMALIRWKRGLACSHNLRWVPR